MENAVIIALVAAAIVFAIRYIYKSKKRGVKCIGCPNGCACSGKCSGDCCGCREDNNES